MKEVQPGIFKRLLSLLFVLAVLGTQGCGSGDGGGKNITTQTLPTDLTLGLECDEVGIYTELCVLEDRRNPFASINIIEFDELDPDSTNKFALADELPAGPAGAKSRFYFWATALARRNSGENQWYTAMALHELWSAGVDDGFGSPNALAQAKKAYRSVLNNFFGSVTFFECCGDVAFSAQLNQLTGNDLFNRDATASPEYPGGFHLIFGTEIDTLSAISEWGFTYEPPLQPLPDGGKNNEPGLMFLNIF
jgi:hypothetical protein